ncbi:MAG: Ig-like domain repeat protein [Isosphaeraceae bacterium]|nr:Ig-like domain repeat protein [Isosphaeraceae bacterium]
MRSRSRVRAEGARSNRILRFGLEALERRIVLSAAPPAWVSIGPAPITDPYQQNLNYNGTYVNPPDITGAIQAIATYRTPQGTQGAYVGAALGGVWETQALFPGSPGWSTHTDNMPSLAINTLGISPLDPTGATVFAGTGPTSNGGVSWKGYGSYPDLSTLDKGLYLSTNGGQSWTALNGPTSPVYGTFISKVLPTSIGASVANETVLVGTEKGLFVSTDGGQTFGPQTFTNPVLDVIADPLDTQRYYLLAGPDGSGNGAGVYLSDNAGQSWTSINGGAIDNQVLALVPTNGGNNGAGRLAATTEDGQTLLYMAFERNDNENTYGVFRTTIAADGTANWQAYYTFPNNEGGGSGNNLGLAIDPSHPDVVYTAGYGGNGTYRLDPDGSGTATATELTNESDGSLYDLRALAFATDPNGHEVLLATSDSGVYGLTDPSTASTLPTWKPLTGNISVTESYSISALASPLGQLDVAGGAQDTAAFQSTISPAGQTSWIAVNGGDGYGSAYDPATEMLYATSDNLGDIQVAQAGTSTIEPVTFTGWDKSDNSGVAFPSLVAVSTAVLGGPFSPSPVAFAGYGLYEAQPASLTSGQVTVTEIKAPGGSGDTYSALSFGGTYQGSADPYILYAAKGDGTLWFSETFGAPVTQLTSWTHGTIVGLQQDPTDSHHVYALTKTALYVTEDAGQTWTAYAVQPPSATLGSFLSLGLVPTTVGGMPTNLLLVGGIDGAEVLPDNPALGQSVWSALGSNLPNAIVTGFAYVPSLNDLVLSTFGRGDWLLSQAADQLVYPLDGASAIALSAPATATFGESVLLSALVTPLVPGQPSPTGSVSFFVLNGDAPTLLGSAPLDATGRAQLLVPGGLPAGALTLQASYSGDVNFGGAETQAVTTVNAAATTVALTAPTTAFTAAPVQLVATVNATGAGVPAGSVTFYDGGRSLGSAAVNATGAATLTVTSFAVGTHTLVAAFQPSDGGEFLPSPSSAPVTIAVAPNPAEPVATTTRLSASLTNPAHLGGRRLVAFGVEVQAGPLAPASGLVELLASGRIVATASLNAMGATILTLPPAWVRNRPISAVYLGGSEGISPATPSQSATFTPTARWFWSQTHAASAPHRATSHHSSPRALQNRPKAPQ